MTIDRGRAIKVTVNGVDGKGRRGSRLGHRQSSGSIRGGIEGGDKRGDGVGRRVSRGGWWSEIGWVRVFIPPHEPK